MSRVGFSNRVLSRFAEATALELGADQFNTILALSKLPEEWAKSESFLKLDAIESATTYASLQAAVRAYFGRGARGTLLRVGGHMWTPLLNDAALGVKAQAAVIKRLPRSARLKSTLELLGRLLGFHSDDITVHTLDLDLLLADHASPSTLNQRDPAPVCFVTRGLIHESLFWAAGQGYDVEETSCKATGENACEFKIIVGE